MHLGSSHKNFMDYQSCNVICQNLRDGLMRKMTGVIRKYVELHIFVSTRYKDFYVKNSPLMSPKCYSMECGGNKQRLISCFLLHGIFISDWPIAKDTLQDTLSSFPVRRSCKTSNGCQL